MMRKLMGWTIIIFVLIIHVLGSILGLKYEIGFNNIYIALTLTGIFVATFPLALVGLILIFEKEFE